MATNLGGSRSLLLGSGSPAFMPAATSTSSGRAYSLLASFRRGSAHQPTPGNSQTRHLARECRPRSGFLHVAAAAVVNAASGPSCTHGTLFSPLHSPNLAWSVTASRNCWLPTPNSTPGPACVARGGSTCTAAAPGPRSAGPQTDDGRVRRFASLSSASSSSAPASSSVTVAADRAGRRDARSLDGRGGEHGSGFSRDVRRRHAENQEETAPATASASRASNWSGAGAGPAHRTSSWDRRRGEGAADRRPAQRQQQQQDDWQGRRASETSGGTNGEGGSGRGRAAAVAAAPPRVAATAPVAAAAAAASAAVLSPPLPKLEPDQQQPQAQDQQAGRVTLPEGVYPTFVPRNPGIQDGQWNEADEGMVRMALRDAAEVVAPRSSSSSSGKASSDKGLVILGSEMADLEALAERFGQPRFRAKQLLEGVLKGAHSVNEITTIPKEWRAQLLAEGVRSGRSLLHHSVGDEDGTRKFLLQLHDGRIVETVGIPTEDRLTVCVSSQVGCPMRCTFCATGKGGFARNLAPHEIIDQVLTVQEQYGRRVTNVVFMGMGEPLLNLPAVVAAYQGLNQQVGIGGAFITISTVGVPNAIRRLASASLKSTLAVSLHAPNQALRESIIPSAKAYPLEALMQDCADYFRISGRRVTFEYTLLSEVNDEVGHARELTALLRRYDMTSSHVNIIPWNPVDESTFVRPSRNRVFAFKRAVEAAGVAVTVRETRGLEAAAACGQLRNRFQKQPLPEFEQPL